MATLEVATRGGATLSPDSPVWGGGTQGERGRGSLGMGGGMTPGPVSYLRWGHACTRQPCS